MSLRSPYARRAVPAAGLAALALLTGCGTGQRAQTYQERSVADATNDSVGAIAVRNLAVSGPATGTSYTAGSSAKVVVTFVNEGGEDDVLESATTPAAASVEVVGPSSTLQVPRLGSTNQSYSLRLVDLTRPLETGTYIDLTLNFRRNGSKTMLVPVQVTPTNESRQDDGAYEVPETDSAGDPITRKPESENSQSEGAEGQTQTGGQTEGTESGS